MTPGLPGTLPHNGQPQWLKAVFAAYFRMAFGECSVRGVDQIPAEGPLIIASTHRSYIDPIVLGTFIPRPIFYMAKSELFRNRAFAALIKAFGSFPVNSEKALGSTFRTAMGLLRQGEAVVIFPEGGIVDSLGEQGYKEGVGLLSSLTGAPVVPIYLENTNTLFSWPAGLTDRTRMAFWAGEPIPPPEGRGREARNRIAEKVGAAIEEMAREYRAGDPPWDGGPP
jgi:1-acyl-sn-glycerol-3-phosphate acyltransferase